MWGGGDFPHLFCFHFSFFLPSGLLEAPAKMNVHEFFLRGGPLEWRRLEIFLACWAVPNPFSKLGSDCHVAVV